jgi:hypothetical protein
MVKNKMTYTLEINSEIGDLQKNLNTVKNSLTALLNNSHAPKGLEKAFEKVNFLLG